MKILFTLNAVGKPPDYGEVASGNTRKIADAVLVFDDGPLAGLELHGFVVWERTVGPTGYSVTGPERILNYGPARGLAYAFLRPAGIKLDVYRPPLSAEFKSFVISEFEAWLRTNV